MADRGECINAPEAVEHVREHRIGGCEQRAEYEQQRHCDQRAAEERGRAGRAAPDMERPPVDVYHCKHGETGEPRADTRCLRDDKIARSAQPNRAFAHAEERTEQGYAQRGGIERLKDGRGAPGECGGEQEGDREQPTALAAKR